MEHIAYAYKNCPVPGGGYDELSGTSMASPNAAGTFACVLQMLAEALIMLLFGELRIMGETILDGAQENIHGFDKTVGFCYNTSINATWGMPQGGSMVFHRLGHDFNFFIGEPFPKILVFTHQASRNQMMLFSSFTQTYVVTSSNDVHHTFIHLIKLCQLQTVGNDL